MPNLKQVLSILPSPPTHWVGDGFPVSSVFSPQSVRTRLSPYVLMDYAGPAKFDPSDKPRGVDTHPHRGFETVTVVFQGELEHRDSAGNSGSIGPGDVQWMTAASGVLHEEKHSRAFTQNGGILEMAQLWVNLPAKLKMSPPRYQTLLKKTIPTVTLPNNAGTARIIAGQFNATPGAAKTFTPVILWDIHLHQGAKVQLPLPSEFNAAIFVRAGSLKIDEYHSLKSRQLALLDPGGQDIQIQTEEETDLLILGGQPLNEPVIAYGPFVMNTHEEIQKAMEDVQAGKLGSLD